MGFWMKKYCISKVRNEFLSQIYVKTITNKDEFDNMVNIMRITIIILIIYDIEYSNITIEMIIALFNH